MGWGILGSIGGAIKNGVEGVGHAVGSVADNPWAKAALAAGLAATGVGAPAAAAIMAGEGLVGGALHNGGGLRDALGGAASGAVEGGAAGALGGALRGGMPSIGSAMSAINGAKSIAGAIPGVGGALGGIPGIGSALGAAGNFLGGNGGQNALATAQAANAALLGKKSSDLANNALDTTQGQWDANAGLRDTGRAALLNPGAGVAPKIAAIPQGRNVYGSPPQIGAAR